jgi:ribosomal protein S18 acetylase RimI-like enzyme
LQNFRIRPAELADLPRCLDIDAGYVTRHVWQMQETFEEPVEPEDEELGLGRSRNQILGKSLTINLPIFQMSLSPSRLPRPLAVSAPLNDQQLLGEWKKTDLLLVAETVDLEPHQAILMDEIPEPSIDEEGQPVLYRPAPPDILGYIGISVDRTRHLAWITTHAVQLDFRRQGVGSALLTEARDWADRHRMRSLLVELEIKNYPAINYFQKNDFFFCGYNNAFYATREIALFFGKRLEKFS